MKIFARRAGKDNGGILSPVSSGATGTTAPNRKNASKDKVIDSSATSSKMHTENQAILKSSDEEITVATVREDQRAAPAVVADPLAPPAEPDLINKKLPRELLIRIFSQLDTIDLSRCAQVSKVSEWAAWLESFNNLKNKISSFHVLPT